jgi:ribosomal protein S18 acetylase RimI-like enzyme
VKPASPFRSIELGVPAQVAWDRLVAPGKRDWYYRLTPDGEFAAGALIKWTDATGKLMEESEVVEASAPRRLVLRTRFLFAPAFAAAEPHLLTWDVETTPGGCRARLEWQSGELISGLLDSEADSILLGLRLAIDPAVQAELARLPNIGEVEIQDVSAERLADYQSFFDHDAFRDFPNWQSCYCMETHRTQDDDEWAGRTAGDNRHDMSEMISRGQVTGLLAYADGKPVGWCNYGETTRLSGLMSKLGLVAPDQEGVGSVACFVIASPYRGHGVASKLLDAAVARLRERGLTAVEGYPYRGADSAQTNYRGPLSMYLRAGFEPYRETERNIVVRMKL